MVNDHPHGEAFISYLTFSITKTPVLLRMTDGHPYESVSSAPHCMAYIIYVSGGAFLGGDASPTRNVTEDL